MCRPCHLSTAGRSCKDFTCRTEAASWLSAASLSSCHTKVLRHHQNAVAHLEAPDQHQQTRQRRDPRAGTTHQAQDKRQHQTEQTGHYNEEPAMGTLKERQRQAENYKRRVDVIDQLRKGQTGPTELLNMIGDTINGTEAVWLNSMKDQGNSIDIEGMALSHDAVASLISNLQKTGRFRNVEIKETFQDASVKEMQAFQFTLTCEIDKGKS